MTTVCVSARAPAYVRPRGTGGACGRASAGPETGVRTVCADPHERVRQGAATRSAAGLELALSTTTGGDGRSQTVRQRYHCVEPRLSLVPHTPSPRGASPLRSVLQRRRSPRAVRTPRGAHVCGGLGFGPNVGLFLRDPTRETRRTVSLTESSQSVSCLKDLLGETRVSAQMLRRVLHQSVLRASA